MTFVSFRNTYTINLASAFIFKFRVARAITEFTVGQYIYIYIDLHRYLVPGPILT